MKIDWRAVRWGIGVFVVLYVIHLLLLPLLIGTEGGGKESDPVLYGVHQFLGLGTCLGSGFVAAKIAGHHGFVHGLIIGAAGTFLSLAAAILWAVATTRPVPSLATVPFWLLINGFLTAFGGLIATNLTESEDADQPS